jgi:hypothetical protein
MLTLMMVHCAIASTGGPRNESCPEYQCVLVRKAPRRVRHRQRIRRYVLRSVRAPSVGSMSMNLVTLFPAQCA